MLIIFNNNNMLLVSMNNIYIKTCFIQKYQLINMFYTFYYNNKHCIPTT